MSDRTRQTKNRRQAQSPDESAGARYRMLPSSDEGERGVVCSAMLAPDILDELQIPPEHFHNPALRTIWEQLRAMRDARAPIDNITVTAHMAGRQLLDEVGGAATIAELFCYLPTATNVRYYAQLLRKKYLARAGITIFRAASEETYESPDEIEQILEERITELVELAATGADRDSVQPIYGFAEKAINEIEYAYANRGGTIGLPTGFVDLDRMIGGWQKGNTIYIGARPAMGKSSLGLAFATETSTAVMTDGASGDGSPVLFFSVEMTGVQLAKRMILSMAKINLQRCRDGFLNKEKDWERMYAAATRIATARLWIDETAALTIADFRARTRRWIKQQRRKNGARTDGKPDGLVIIDYLQRMKGSSKRSEDARYLELQEIAQGISQVAKDLQVPIIVLAQLKRPKDKKPDTEPDMTEFRECGDIEQEAHCVALLHRPIYYVKHNDEKKAALAADYQERFQNQARFKGKPDWESVKFTVQDLDHYCKLIIDKQREGPVGPVDLRFVADYTLFQTWDPDRRLYSNNAAQRQLTPDQAEAAAEPPAAEPEQRQSDFLEDPES